MLSKQGLRAVMTQIERQKQRIKEVNRERAEQIMLERAAAMSGEDMRIRDEEWKQRDPEGYAFITGMTDAELIEYIKRNEP